MYNYDSVHTATQAARFTFPDTMTTQPIQTAVYGPRRTVVWQGKPARAYYADLGSLGVYR